MISTYTSCQIKPLARSSQRRCVVRKAVLKNFAKFTGKHLRQSLPPPPPQSRKPEARNPTKKEALAQVFLREFCKISLFTEHPRTTASAWRSPILLHPFTLPCTINPPHYCTHTRINPPHHCTYTHTPQAPPQRYGYPHLHHASVWNGWFPWNLRNQF